MANGILTRTLFSSPQILCILPTGKHIENLNHDVAVVYESRVEFLKTHTDGSQEIVQTLEYWPEGGIIAAGVSWNRKAIFVSTQRSSLESIDLASDSFPRRPYTFVNSPSGKQLSLEDQTIIYVKSDPQLSKVVALSKTGLVWHVLRPDRESDSEGQGLLYHWGNLNMTIAAAEFLKPTWRITEHDSTEVTLHLLVLGHDFEDRPIAKVMNFEQYREPWICSLLSSEALMNQVKHLAFLLIPLQKHDGMFLLIEENIIAPYKIDYTDHTPRRESFPIQARASHSLDETDFTSSPYIARGVFLRGPLWRGWSQPTRRDGDYNDAFYLFREDGGMIYLTVEGEEVRLHAGGMRHLPTIPNGAAASIPTDRTVPDVFLIGGECCDGGVYNIGRGSSTRQEAMMPKQTDVLPDWSHLLDIAVEKPKGVTGQIADKLVVTSGKFPFGFLAQVRIGYEAVVRVMTNFSEIQSEDETPTSAGAIPTRNTAGFKATQMWNLYLGTDGDPSTLLSSPTETIAVINTPHSQMLITRDDADFLGCTTLDAMQFNGSQSRSLSAQGTLVMRVTPMRIEVLQFVANPPQIIQVAMMHTKSPQIVAAIGPGGKNIVTAAQDEVTYIKMASNERPTVAFSHTIGHVPNMRPTSASIMHWRDGSRNASDASTSNNMIIVAVADTKGHVNLWEIQDRTKPKPKPPVKLSDVEGVEAPAICDSIAPTFAGLACGLRSGQVVSIVLGKQEKHVTKVGNSTVWLRKTGPRNILFAVCDGRILHLEYSFSPEPFVNYVWLINDNKRTEDLRVLDIRTGTNGENKQSILALTGDRVLKGRITPGPIRHLPLRLQVKDGTPNRVVFSDQLQCHFIASEVVIVDDESGIRYVTPKISIIERQKGDYCEERELYKAQPGQKVSSLTIWDMHRNGEPHPQLVLTTINKVAQEHDGAFGRGSIFIFNIKSNDNRIFLGKPKQRDLSYASTASCQYDNNTLLYSTGTAIRKWAQHPTLDKYQAEIALQHEPMGAVQFLSARPPYVYISFADGSARVYKLQEHSLEYVTGEDRSRPGLAHLALPEHGVLLATSKDKTVIGLPIPRATANEQDGQHESSGDSDGAEPVFEAKLPGSVTRLVRADGIRPPWKRGPLPVGVVARDIVGVSTTGAGYAFSVVSEGLRLLLEYVTGLALSHWRDRVELGPLPAYMATRQGHVNGDVLAWFTGTEMETALAVVAAELKMGEFRACVRGVLGETWDEGEDDEVVAGRVLGFSMRVVELPL